jgi:Zn-dependent M28 family amino/carboxypeptidase
MHKISFSWLMILLVLASTGCRNDAPTTTSSTSTTEASVSLDIPRFNRDSAYAYIEKQVAFGPRVPGTEAHQANKEWMASKLRSFGLSVTEQDFEATAYTGEQLSGTNIFAQINPESTQRILLGAHWDSRPIADSPLSTERQDEPILGADDGASGVGVLIELARLLAKDTSLSLGIDIILFDLEDYGQSQGDGWALGSQYWSANLPYGKNKPEYGILLDMVGSKGARFAKEEFSMQFAPDVMNKVWQLAGYMGYSNYFVNQRGGRITDDHYYVNTIAKIPMIDIINQKTDTPTGFGDYWHTHNDNMEVIDKATLRAVGKVLLEVIYREEAGIF